MLTIVSQSLTEDILQSEGIINNWRFCYKH